MLPTEIPDQIQQTLAVVVTLREQLAAAVAVNDGKAANQSKYAGMAASLARSIKELSTEARQWSTLLKADAKAATLDDKVAAVIRFVQSLAKPDRKRVYAGLRNAELDRPDGLTLDGG